jgi:signal transduction histidine kinase
METILIVDDIPQNIKILGTILHRQGYHIEFAMKGQAALQWVSEKSFDLILLDVMMPEMDGFEVCRQLKQNPQTAEIPVIFLTAKTDSESVVKGFEAGAVDFLSKPFNTEELLARVSTHLSLQRQKRELKELNAAKDKFFSILSHDLINPFNSILGLTDLMKKEYQQLSETEKIYFIGLIHDAAQQGYMLLSDLLIWGRENMKKVRFDPSNHVLHNVVDGIMALTNNHATQKQIEVTNKIPSEITVFADEEMLKIILRNLLTNAIKFTPAGGSVWFEALQNEDETIVKVGDTGIGIAAEVQSSLFQIDSTYSSNGTNGEKGTGLGLVLCKDFIEKHNGTIQVESHPGKGTIFTCSFPANAKE